MTNITLVRHAESLLNTKPELIVGRSNHSPLTKRGFYQASLLGSYLHANDLQFDAIYSSGAVRADQTAESIIHAAGYDQGIIIDERLQEVSQGPWEGKRRYEVYTQEIVDRYRLNDIDRALLGAETVADAQVRMCEFVRGTETIYPEGNLLIVSHGLAIRALVGKLRLQTKADILKAQTPNVSLTNIHVSGGIVVVGDVGKKVINE